MLMAVTQRNTVSFVTEFVSAHTFLETIETRMATQLEMARRTCRRDGRRFGFEAASGNDAEVDAVS